MTNGKKKIMYISNFGDVKGGGEISLLTLIRELDRDKYEPHIILPEPGNMKEKAAKLGTECTVMKIPSLRSLSQWYRFIRESRKFSTFLISQDISLVHANTNTNKSIFSGLAARMAKIPCVCHVRIMDSDGYFEKIVLGLFDRVITNSNATAKKYMRYKGSMEKVITVHNAVDMEDFKPGPPSAEIRAALGAGPDDILVCNVGFLHEFKGHRYFIEAAHKLRDNNHIKFAIIGDGPMMEECAALIKKLGVENSVYMAGQRNDVPDIMRSMDILVLSSNAEHFGRVIIEAMACGKPVIGTRAGGVPEIIDEGVTGLMVPPGNPEAMAEAIVRLAKDKDAIKSMGTMGAMAARERFSAATHAAAIQNIYNSLLSEKIPVKP